MNKVITEYYAQANISHFLMNQKAEKLERNPDISDEFEYWITHKKYKSNGLVINGYSAQSLANLSRFLEGEGSFMLLIELRENPDKAKRQIQEGFKLK